MPDISKIKIIALYLPQFHTIPENDKWWGKGFTDWINVRKATPLFYGHEQPRIPLNNDYYDLSQVDAIRRQVDLAKRYKVDGFCFYHYWFAGKMLLEKPAELLLANTDIDFPFCFSWANEPWARTWDGKAHQVIMPQNYGNIEDWRVHFNYLLPFFHDSRYIKVDGAPMFVIYKTKSIPCCAEMMDEWNRLAKENGFPYIHFVETLRDADMDNRTLPLCARMEFEPVMANYCQGWLVLNYKRIRRRILTVVNRLFGTAMLLNKPFAFSEVARRAIALQSPEGTYGGVFVGWDNTARRGLASTIVLPPTKQEFKSFLLSEMKKTAEVYHADFVFVNAWNEWAEGTYLEPDEVHRFDYLEAIKETKD